MPKYPGEPVDCFETRSSTAAERRAKKRAELMANWTWFKRMPASGRNQRRGVEVNRARQYPRAARP